MADAFATAFSFLKALQPSPHHMDEGLSEEQMRHYNNMQRMKARFGGQPESPLPMPENQPLRNLNPGQYPFSGPGGPRMSSLPDPTIEPEGPAPEPPMHELDPLRFMSHGQPREIKPINVSGNPMGRLKEGDIQNLADEFYIPMKKAWEFLKALPEQQMFVERSPRQNVTDDYDYEYEDRPEIDRYGARSLGTVHPAILGMLQRRTDDYHQHYGMSPNLNLDLGAEEDRRMSGASESSIMNERKGLSIARGPDFNRRLYDGDGGFFGGGASEEIAHNPNRAAPGNPFGVKEGRMKYGPYSHRYSHPTQDEL